MTFPCNSFVLELDDAELTAIIRQSTAKRISEKRVTYLVDKLTKLANQSYCEVKENLSNDGRDQILCRGVT